MNYLSDIKEDATLRFLWSTNDASGGAVTRTVDGGIRVYKNDDLTQITSGITDTEDFDGITGVHLCEIDTSADAAYVTGADYSIVLVGATVDGQTVNGVIGIFSIENRAAIVHLEDIKGTGFVKDTNSLTNVTAGQTNNITVRATVIQ